MKKYITGFLGSSTCRVCRMRNGSSEYASLDGKWLYPSGYSHYISDHNVKPPSELITDVMDWFKEKEKIKFQEWLKENIKIQELLKEKIKFQEW